MAGIETNRFVGLDEVMAKHLECGICLNVYLKPMDTKCKHTFCCHCITTSIQNNGKECPECRQPLITRKRSESSANVVVIGDDVILEKNRKIDNMINDLKIRCDYHYNGCEEVLTFALLSSHLLSCPFGLCSDCGVVEDKDNPHNCVLVLKKANNDLKDKMKEMSKELETKDKSISDLNKQLIECQKQLNDISVNNQMNENIGKELPKVDFTFTPYYVTFGNYMTIVSKVSCDSIGMTLLSVCPNNRNGNFNSHISIPFLQIQELKYCLDSNLTAIFIKPVPYKCESLREQLCLRQQFITEFIFDVHSNEIDKQFIKIVFNFLFEDKFIGLVNITRIANNNCLIEAIDANTARQLLT